MTSTDTVTRTWTQTAWGAYEHDTDLLSAAMAGTVASLRSEIKERVGDEPLNWSAFWRMPKTHLAAIVAEWATFERQNEREAEAVTREHAKHAAAATASATDYTGSAELAREVLAKLRIQKIKTSVATYLCGGVSGHARGCDRTMCRTLTADEHAELQTRLHGNGETY